MKVVSIEIEDETIMAEVEGFENNVSIGKHTLWNFLMRQPKLIHWTMQEYFAFDEQQIKVDVENYINSD